MNEEEAERKLRILLAILFGAAHVCNGGAAQTGFSTAANFLEVMKQRGYTASEFLGVGQAQAPQPPA